MGDPRKPRKKYMGPRHPWEKARIDMEKELMRTYGFKNKKELWKMSSLLKAFFDRAKTYAAIDNPQYKKEQKQLFERLNGLGLLQGDNSLDSILGIELKDILERRLQTLVYKKGFARSMKQSRQFITHGHITVNGKLITSPSFLVSLSEEATIAYTNSSALSDETHPERNVETVEVPGKEQKPEEKEEVKEKPKAEEKKEKPKTEEKKEDPKEDKKEESEKKEEVKEEKPKAEEKKEEPKEEKSQDQKNNEKSE